MGNEWVLYSRCIEWHYTSIEWVDWAYLAYEEKHE